MKDSITSQVLPGNEEKVAKYDTHCHRQMLSRYKLGFVLATTSLPESIIQNEDFKAYISLLDPKHSVPSRVTTYIDQSDIQKAAKDIVKEMLGKNKDG